MLLVDNFPLNQDVYYLTQLVKSLMVV